MTFALFGSHKDHIAHKLRPRPNHGHVALEDVEQFREFIQAGAAKELSVSGQAFVIREQVAVLITLVGHGAELDELEDLFVLARARLRKERVALHLDGAEYRKYDENRAQADEGCQSTEEVKRAFKEAGVHVLNVTGSFASLRMTE